MDHARVWNVNVFGHIGKKKKELLAQLRGIDHALCIYHSDFLVQLDLDLRAKLAEVLRHEESLWLQKLQVQWANFGDRNTAYFHRNTMQRRRANFVPALCDSSGVWCSDQSHLRSLVMDFYSTLFSIGGAHIDTTVRCQFR
ncbi:hypothetical protein V6N12_036034 [Hibiscus sabdariffa]|uniref:Uncharacterized protein n=1 Tax=Hibiscus sabdariffa TaxID=183260 RepID=A0ABR2ERA2_9ROSI